MMESMALAAAKGAREGSCQQAHNHAPCGMQVVFIDRNKDMWMRRALQGGRPLKLAAMVDCAVWHASVDMLATLTDHRLVSVCPQQRSLTCKTDGLQGGMSSPSPQRSSMGLNTAG